MNLTILKKEGEPLLGRTKVVADMGFDKSTPSYAEIRSSLAAQLSTSENLIALRHVYTSFGARKAKVEGYVYSDAAKMAEAEPKVKAKKEKQPKQAAGK